MLLASQAAGYLPRNLPIDVIERYVSVAHAVKTAKLRYVPPPLAVTIRHYLAADRDAVWVMDDWEKVADRVTYDEVGGNHMTMVEPPHARALARRISEDMARASPEHHAVDLGAIQHREPTMSPRDPGHL
jgi:thioesterase domain-containing protein